VRHSPRKRFGQNFLNSWQVIDAILKAINPQTEDNLLEIGPGLGALTLPLLRRLSHMTAVEIDRDLQKYWSELPSAQGKLNLIAEDALKLDYSQFGAKLRIIGNLPYNISTPLLFRVLDFIPFIKDMHFMLQKEVVERMAAQPKTKEYGRLSVILQYYCDIEYLFDVPPEAFDPEPKVNSALVRLVPYQVSPYDKVNKVQLERLVANSFAMRRKTLNNNLKGLVSVEQLSHLGIDGTKRPEEISVSEYVQLAKFFSN
jgi:16S rRNA (adenine1518-N6/adenine1519-N6)-dimethyltransferase